MRRLAKSVVFAICGILTLAVIGSMADTKPTPADEYRAVITAMKRQVGARLKDSVSARWGDVWSPDTMVVCGYVNAKNSFGAYDGDQLFWGMGSIVYFDRDLRDLTAAERALPLEMRAKCQR